MCRPCSQTKARHVLRCALGGEFGGQPALEGLHRARLLVAWAALERGAGDVQQGQVLLADAHDILRDAGCDPADVTRNWSRNATTS